MGYSVSKARLSDSLLRSTAYVSVLDAELMASQAKKLLEVDSRASLTTVLSDAVKVENMSI